MNGIFEILIPHTKNQSKIPYCFFTLPLKVMFNMNPKLAKKQNVDNFHAKLNDYSFERASIYALSECY